MKKPDHVLTWFEIPAADLGRAKSFYETIFEAEFTEMKIGDELKMALFPVIEGGIGDALCEHKQFYHPGLLVVDRWLSSPYENYLTPENRVPDEALLVPWESCITMGNSWSYVPNDK